MRVIRPEHKEPRKQHCRHSGLSAMPEGQQVAHQRGNKDKHRQHSDITPVHGCQIDRHLGVRLPKKPCRDVTGDHMRASARLRMQGVSAPGGLEHLRQLRTPEHSYFGRSFRQSIHRATRLACHRGHGYRRGGIIHSSHHVRRSAGRKEHNYCTLKYADVYLTDIRFCGGSKKNAN